MDPVLQSFGDKCRTWFDEVTKNNGVDQLKVAISSVSKINTEITDTIKNYEDEFINWMAGEKECLKVVEQYFNTTSELLEFCCALDSFVVSARNSHLYITYVIQQLETDYGIETPNDDENGDNKSRNLFSRIVKELENLRGSDMVSCSDSAERLFRSIQRLQEKFDDMAKTLQQYKHKLQKKLQSNRIWNMIFTGTIVTAAVLSLLGGAILLAHPHLAVLAGSTLIGPAVTMLVANPNTVAGIVGVLEYLLPVLIWGNSLFKRTEDQMRNQLEVVHLMKDGDTIAIKELGNIKYFIDSLLVHIDSIVKKGKFGMNGTEVYSAGFAIKAIKDDLGIFLEKIEELAKEQKKCSSEILKSRDDVLAKVISKVKVVKK